MKKLTNMVRGREIDVQKDKTYRKFERKNITQLTEGVKNKSVYRVASLLYVKDVVTHIYII